MGKGAPTIAMQPEWLTSTVTALALCLCESSSHSTRNFTREITRLCVRIWAQRSSSLSIGFFRTFMATANLTAVDFVRGLGAVTKVDRSEEHTSELQSRV